ncbi:MAG: ABC transporter permease subunit [Fibrobacter sp.]|nr:ABC transporter permease subunit [Fibrobacter sp.]
MIRNVFKMVATVALALSAIAFVGCNESDPLANRVNKVSDLGKKKVGVQIGNTADIYASEYGGDTAKIDVERYTKLADAVQALKQGKIDAVLLDDQPAIYFVKQNPTLRILEEAFVEETYAGVIAKGNEGLLDTFNLVLKEMHENGVFDSLMNTYINGSGEYHYAQKVKEGEHLVLATNAQFPPYEYHEGDKIVGLEIELAYYLADKMGRVLEIQDIEFDAVINAVSSGKADLGLSGFTVTEERKKSINFTDKLVDNKVVVMVRSDIKPSELDNKVFAVSDLGKKKVGVQIGNTADIYASEYGGDTNKIDVERFTKLADAVQALKQGKIDAVLLDDQPAIYFVKQNPTLRVLDEAFVEETYAGVIAKGREGLLDTFNVVLKEMHDNGIFDSLMNTYINGTGSYHYAQKVKEGEHLVLATNAQFPPYEYHEGEFIVGLEIELAYYLADKMGRVLEIQDIEFDAVINAVSSGKADLGLSGFTVTEERKKSINFTDKLVDNRVVVLVRTGMKEASEETFGEKFHKNFIKDNRWKYIAEGLRNTLIIAVCAALLGILIGFLVAMVRVNHEFNGKYKIANWICKAYLAVIRGTPMMVQLLIIYYIVFSSVNINKLLVAIIAFGINSGAYVSEIIRGGIKAVDPGQIEAGRSLGLKFKTVMLHVVYPQAFKNSLPALTNEFISLIKETSICGYIGLTDLTRGGDIIRSLTYEAMFPLISVAIVYFIIVAGLSACVARLEKRLKKNER